MRKIKLNVESLAVESFETAAAGAAQGTVLGAERTRGTNDACQTPIDGCATGFCAPTSDALCETQNCETYDPELCPSVVDACPTARCV